jgi:hypothetical protein
MVLNADCSITGRPTSAGPFVFHVIVRVEGFAGSVDVSTSVWVASPVITYTDHIFPAVPVGTSLNDLPRVSGWTAPADATPTFSYTLASGALPPGTSLDPATGRISGNVGVQGSFRAGIAATMTTPFGSYQLPAGNYAVNADVGTFRYLDYGGTGTVDGFYRAWVGIRYDSVPSATDPSATLTAFQTLSGSLPAGLALDSVTGNISGVPQAITAPTTVAAGATITRFGVANPTQADFKVRVDAPTVIGWRTPTTMPINVPYTLQIAINDATSLMVAPAIVAAPRAGSCILPPGLTMAVNGSVSGTPTATGTFDCTVDFTATLNGASWTQQGDLSLTVQ